MRIPFYIGAALIGAYITYLSWHGVVMLRDFDRIQAEQGTLECVTFSDGRVVCQLQEKTNATD